MQHQLGIAESQQQPQRAERDCLLVKSLMKSSHAHLHRRSNIYQGSLKDCFDIKFSSVSALSSAIKSCISVSVKCKGRMSTSALGCALPPEL